MAVAVTSIFARAFGRGRESPGILTTRPHRTTTIPEAVPIAPTKGIGSVAVGVSSISNPLVAMPPIILAGQGPTT